MTPPRSPGPSPHFEALIHRSFVERVVAETRSGPGATVVADHGCPPGRPDLIELAAATGISIEKLTAAHADARRSAYFIRTIPKQNGRIRTIAEPSNRLKVVQRHLLRWLESQDGAQPHDCAHGFVKGRSHVSHAKLHVGRRVVASVDIQDCFDSITDLHVWLQLRKLGLTQGAGAALVELVTIEAQHARRPHGVTALTRALELIEHVFRSRYPTTWLALSANGPLPKPVKDLVGAELGMPGELVRTLRLDRDPLGWSAPAQRLARFRRLRGDPVAASRHRLLDACATELGLSRTEYRTADGLVEVDRLRDGLIAGGHKRPPPPVLWSVPAATPQARLVLTDADGAALVTRHPDLYAIEKHRIPMNYRVLPQGAPTSPFLCNIALRELDDRVAAYAQQARLTYTRYADDLAFSGDSLPCDFVRALTRLLEAEGLRINREKVNANWRDSRQVVTGLTVNDRLAPAPLGRRRLRALQHHLRTGQEVHIRGDGTDAREILSESATLGWLAYWHMVDERRVPDPVKVLKGE